MKITCNIIEDLLPLYVDDMVSEDSRKLVEEHLKECLACQKMQEEMMRENCLSAGRKDGNSAQINKTEAEPLKKNPTQDSQKKNTLCYSGSCSRGGSRRNRTLLVL